jgi:hypothetical protein
LQTRQRGAAAINISIHFNHVCHVTTSSLSYVAAAVLLLLLLLLFHLRPDLWPVGGLYKYTREQFFEAARLSAQKDFQKDPKDARVCCICSGLMAKLLHEPPCIAAVLLASSCHTFCIVHVLVCRCVQALVRWGGAMLELAHFKQGTEADDYIKEVMTNQQAPAPAPAPAGARKSSSAWTVQQGLGWVAQQLRIPTMIVTDNAAG